MKKVNVALAALLILSIAICMPLAMATPIDPRGLGSTYVVETYPAFIGSVGPALVTGVLICISVGLLGTGYFLIFEYDHIGKPPPNDDSSLSDRDLNLADTTAPHYIEFNVNLQTVHNVDGKGASNYPAMGIG